MNRRMLEQIVVETQRLITRRTRMVAVLLMLVLLIASLPSSGRTQTIRVAANTQPSFAAEVYRDVSNTVAAIGTWVAGFVHANPSVAAPAYQPVAAYILPAPPFIDAPTSLSVTSTSSSSINLSWTAPAGTVDHYIVERSDNVNGPFVFLANVTGATTKNDATVTNLHAYLYRVRAVTSVGAISSPSNMALGTAISFEFSSLTNQLIKAQHFQDARTAINLVRGVGNVPAASWARSNLANLDIKADDVNEMRIALDAGLTALNITPTAYTDPTLAVGSTLVKAIHVEELQTRSTRGSSTSTGPMDSDSSSARLDPLNETGGDGENPLSRNFNWSLPVLFLPGRAGLDLGLSLSYNSLVWTKGSNSIWFDPDNGFPGPGFRLGFPVIQQRYYNAQVGKQAYLVVKPDGSHTELRQVGSTNFYESADSAHLLLDENTMTVQTTDGTQMNYVLYGGEFQCTKIKDRNGNYISITYNASGRINTITDTLNRVITFNYTTGSLTSITQAWNGVTQNWARFEYANKTIDTNFPGLTLFGPADGVSIQTLTKIRMADDTSYDFSYTSWGQVWKITKSAADGSVLNYRSYDLPQTGTLAFDDCPRFTVRKEWARYWNGDTDGTVATSEEVATSTFIIPESVTFTMPEDPSTNLDGMRAQVTSADGTINKFYYIGLAGQATGWRRGLVALVDTFSGGGPDPVKRVSTNWTQDNTSLAYPLNPRVTETNVRDSAGNRARTAITYQQFALSNGMTCNLPSDVYEYAADATTKLRSTRTLYNMTATYTNLRILGLLSEKQVYEGDVTGPLSSKVGYFYDDDNGATSIVTGDTPVRQENPAYVNGRANLSSIRRYDATDTAQFVTIRLKYNPAGSVVSTKDAAGHETLYSYADSYSDGNNSRGTFAYPTTVTDPDTFVSTAKYNYDYGAVTSQRTPKPNEVINKPESERPERVFTYDSIGRLLQVTNSVNAASTRRVYSTAGNRIDTYTKFEASLAEGHSWEITDGLGRLIATAKDHTVSTYSGQKFVFDNMGRVIKTSNPTETNASGHPSGWSAVGDDATIGWLYTEQTYDWKNRPLVTTNQDGTTETASYSGCGCAGGEVVTKTDEGTIDPFDLVTPRKRQQKIYSDVLGRTFKTELLNWEGGAVHAATVNTYNARDQITMVRQFAGPAPSDPADLSCPSGTCQKTDSVYDGHGRLKTKHKPEQQVDSNNPASTDHDTWDYNADDTVQKVTDPRGAVSTYTYDGRHHATNIAYTLLSGVPTTGPSGVASAATVSYQYDAAGNRKQMTDGMGTVTYNYDLLSRMTSETRFFSSLSGSWSGGNYTLSYEYNLANQLNKLTDPYTLQLNYGYDTIGRLSGVTGVGFSVSTFLSNIQYRAWGAAKSVAHVNGRTAETTYDARLRVSTYQLLTIVPDDHIRLHNQYDYFPDGRLKKLTDLDDHDPSIIGFTDSGRWFTRIYRYDNRGRIMRARGYNQPNNFEFDRPFDLFYGYDSFNHLTTRSGSYYYATNPGFSDSATFVNNRRTGWTYGADGQETHSTATGSVRDHVYDAAGKMVQVKQTITATNQVSTYVTNYDGDGQLVREFLQEDVTNTTSYKINSTVVGMDVTRLNNAGNKTGTTIPLDQRVTPARMTSADTGGVPFPTYEDPLHQSIAGDMKAVYDPLGNLIPWRPSPQSSPPPSSYPRSSASFGGLGSLFGNAQESSCQVDGIPTNCDLAMRLKNNGSAMQCPYNDCSPQRRDFVNPDGERFSFLTLPFMAFGDDTFGYFLGGWAELGTPQEQAEALRAQTIAGLDGARTPGNYFQEPQQLPGPKPAPAPTPVPPAHLPDCVKKFFSQFAYFDKVVNDITYTTNGVPEYVPISARAFTFGDHIYFSKGEFDPSNGVSDEEMILLAHETRHVTQYRAYGKKTFAADYLWESAKRGLEGAYLGGPALAFELSYWGNEYEAEARDDEAFMRRHIERFGNPCR